MEYKNMRTLLMDYQQYHLNPVNVRCHSIGIPLIFYGLFGLLLLLSPYALLVLIVLLLAYYGIVARYLAVGAVVATGVVCILVFLTELILSWPTWAWYIGMFVLGWVLQFLGHRAEGNKPAFFRNPIYLIVGPLWLMEKIYNRFGWRVE